VVFTRAVLKNLDKAIRLTAPTRRFFARDAFTIGLRKLVFNECDHPSIMSQIELNSKQHQSVGHLKPRLGQKADEVTDC
jgi:hypothetical protein